MQNKFLAIITEHDGTLKKDNKIFNIIGYIKLLLVALEGGIIYLLFRNDFPLELIILLAAAVALSAVLWVYHAKLHNKIDYSKGIIAVCKQHIDRITGEWTNFEDTGGEFIDAGHAYACDLDIAGKKSLFQFLNTTHTWHGRQAFSDDLLRPAYERSELYKRQEAIAELSKDIEFANRIQYYLSQIEADSSSARLVDYLKDRTAFINNKILRVILNYAPALTLLFIVGIFAFRQTNLYLISVTIIAVQAVLCAAAIPRIHKYLGVMGHLPYKLNAYNDVINILANKEFSCEKLKNIHKKLNEASKAIKDLSKIDSKIKAKQLGIIYLMLNIFLLWDYDCAFLLQKWKLKYSHLAEQWFSAIGEFESLMCFSHLPNVCNNTCLPVINENESGSIIEANRIGHPLLTNEKRVNNEFYFNNSIFIVSGSNMSGKTTFLRTVGINMVLARSGGFVCAEKMLLSPLDVITSMRITDDLNEGVSTFYAELNRIKKIIDFAKEQPNMLFLIDEIFKGTNSVDRLTGAKTVIEKLNELGAAGLISTHDLELCELENIHGRIKNHSFSEYYRDNRIYFDYLIKQGKSKTANAKYLMKMVGIFD